MDEEWRKKYPWFPADYVTFDMLRERWLKKQEEQKLKEKQDEKALEETQNLEKDCKNQPHGELEDGHRSENNGPGKRVGNDGGEMALTEGKGKGKKKGRWSGNGRITNNKSYRSRYKEHEADWTKGGGDISKVKMEDRERRQNPRSKEGLDLIEKENGPKGVEIILKNKEKVGITGFLSGESSGNQAIGKIMSGDMTGLLPNNLPNNGVREGSSLISMAKDVRRDGFRGGFRRNENDRDEGFRDKEHSVEPNKLKDNNSLGKKMEDEVVRINRKGDGRKCRNRRRKGGKFKQSGTEMSGLKLNEVELKSANESSEIVNERDRMKSLHSGTGSNDNKLIRVDGEALTADTLVLENKVEDSVLAEKSRNGIFRGYGDRRGNLREKIENLTIDYRKGRYLGSKVERKFRGNRQHVNYGRLELDQRMKQRNCSMVWVKKEQSVAVGGAASSMEFCQMNSS